jgi:hypothetical protein
MLKMMVDDEKRYVLSGIPRRSYTSLRHQEFVRKLDRGEDRMPGLGTPKLVLSLENCSSVFGDLPLRMYLVRLNSTRREI